MTVASTSRVVRTMLMAAVMSLLACDPDAAMWLRIEAPFAIPTDCDAVQITVTRPDGDTAYSQLHALHDGQAFPLTLSLTTDNDANLAATGLVVTVTARKSGAEVSSASTPATLERNHLVPVTVTLRDDRPPAG